MGRSGVPRAMPQVEHVVMVMMENRSLDNVLGWLYRGSRPQHNVPAVSQPYYGGLIEGADSLPLRPHSWDPTTYYPIIRGTTGDGPTVPNLDPNEGFPNVLNQCFGDATTTVMTAPPDGTFATMQGFLQDFDAWDDTWDQTLQITKTYDVDELPVLNTLARSYAVSDAFWSSMPTETDPNRAFSLCGTALGKLVNGDYEQYKTRTLWNALATQGTTMGLYYHEEWWNGQCYTQWTFPNLSSVHAPLLTIAQIDDPANGFTAMAARGTLPAFSYIEPKWGYGVGPHTFKQGNDYHPPTNVMCGEALLAKIYTAMTGSPLWNKSLLIVAFDEHGGTYDHEPLLWGAPNPGDPGSLGQTQFDYHLYGVRVPMLLVSPFVPASTVFRASGGGLPYDHTSTIATLLKWQGIEPAGAGLWNRVATAPTWEGVLASEVVNQAIQLPSVAGLCPPPEQDVFAGVPTAVVRAIARKSRSLETAHVRLEDYRRRHLRL